MCIVCMLKVVSQTLLFSLYKPLSLPGMNIGINVYNMCLGALKIGLLKKAFALYDLDLYEYQLEYTKYLVILGYYRINVN